MSKDKKLRMWIYFSLLVAALLIVVLAVHFSKPRDVIPPSGTSSGTSSFTSSCSTGSKENTLHSATITFYMFRVSNEGDISLATITLTSSLSDTSTDALIKTALDYMARPPVHIDGFYPVLPENTKVRSITIKEDGIHIDFSKDILFPKYPSATSESLALCAIAGIPSFYGIDNTYITVEGKSKGPVDGKYVEDFWGHVGLYDQPLHPCK